MYGVEPDLTREGGSIPITLVFEVSHHAVLQPHASKEKQGDGE